MVVSFFLGLSILDEVIYVAFQSDIRLSRVISGLCRAGKCIYAEQITFGSLQASVVSLVSHFRFLFMQGCHLLGVN